MKSEITLTNHSATTEQLEVFKAVGKALNVKITIDQKNKKKSVSRKKQLLLKSIERGLNDIKLIKAGKLKGTPIKEFLDEL
jgi:hypothetical protein